MIYFEINGKKVQPNNIKDVLEKAVLQNIESQIRDKVGSIRDPKTGEFPTIVCKGKTLDKLSFSVEGSPEMIALVREKLGAADNEENTAEQVNKPIAFISYAFEDTTLAKQIATALQNNGIETFWADWSINNGESLRQKIESGLGECTHFIVLLTPISITKTWVNAEIDAGFTRKLENKCRFIPLRSGLPPSSLSPFLKTLRSPEISDSDKDISQLINDIHGISRKPPLGEVPKIIQEVSKLGSSYSPAAMAIAKVIVDKSETACFADPQLSQKEVQEITGLSNEDMDDALHEISVYFNTEFERILPHASFFAEFDKFWQPWNPEEDALRLAADMVNDSNFPDNTSEIAEIYGWSARRINPAIIYLADRKLIDSRRFMGHQPWFSLQVYSTAATRRFVKSRSL